MQGLFCTGGEGGKNGAGGGHSGGQRGPVRGRLYAAVRQHPNPLLQATLPQFGPYRRLIYSFAGEDLSSPIGFTAGQGDTHPFALR